MLAAFRAEGNPASRGEMDRSRGTKHRSFGARFLLSAAAVGPAPGKPQKTMCQLRGCREEQFQDEGVQHDFCCRSHAQLAKARGDWPPPNTRGSTGCALPGCKEAVYCDPETGKASDFCSEKHVKHAKTRECLRSECSRTAFLANVAGPQFSSRACADEVSGETAPTLLMRLTRDARCSLASCQKKALRSKTWRSLRFCSEAHRILHVRRESQEAAFEQSLVSADTSPELYTVKVMVAQGGASTVELHFLDEGHPEHKSLSDQFVSKWEHKKPAKGVEVLDIIKIEVPHEIHQRHEDYKKMVPNVRRRFHGTSSTTNCRFYVGGSMCLRPDCGLCGICMRGFKLEENIGTSPTRGSRARWLMYGRGIYFSSVSGKANDFSKETKKRAHDGTMVRCMLVADVAAGNAYLTYEKDFPEMTEPPPGYHSVVGEVGPQLNYDELVVYDPAAALPTHFVVYRQ